jgi:hypothetical protein
MRMFPCRVAVLLTGLITVASIAVATAPASAAGPDLSSPATDACPTASGCDITLRTPTGTFRGRYLYRSHVRLVDWPDGHWEYFLIGTNGAMYRLRQGTTYGWVKMGGTFADMVRADITDNRPTVSGVTTSGNVWCFSYYSSDWHLWDC